MKDCRTLLALRDALGSVGWSAATPITYWAGVSLNRRIWIPRTEPDRSDARVTRIAFGGGPEARHFGGPIPPELGQLSALESLTLAGVGMTGPIPPELGKLTRLRELFLTWNSELTGPIPPELGQLTNLAHLYLNNNALAGPIPPELGNLIQLRKLKSLRQRIDRPRFPRSWAN